VTMGYAFALFLATTAGSVPVLTESRRAEQFAVGSVRRGAYLVNAVMACDNCHTPRGPNGLIMAARFSGGTEVWDTPKYTVRGSNITPDRATGIGGWTDDDVKRLLTEGLKPNGVRVSPQMPYGLYRAITPSDLDAVVAYLRTIKPIRRESPAPIYKVADYAALGILHRDRSAPGKGSDKTIERGEYLASLAYCMACHARRPDGVVDFKNWWGRGGFVMKGTFGSVVVTNISSHLTKGVGSRTDAQLRRALTHGIGHDGRVMMLPMARQSYYRKMSREDLRSIIAWLRTIPPIE
jgi:mono/diheme cytochrome c family protein